MRRALVVVDMQNDFVDEKVLGNKECQAVIPKIKNKIEEGNYDVLYITQDTHDENYLNTQEGKNLPVPHCLLETKGWEIVDEIKKSLKKVHESKEVILITKDRFGSTTLAKLISLGNFDEVEFVGICTGICVISNVLVTKTMAPEVKIIVDSDCCACVTKESHETALNAMKACQVEII